MALDAIVMLHTSPLTHCQEEVNYSHHSRSRCGDVIRRTYSKFLAPFGKVESNWLFTNKHDKSITCEYWVMSGLYFILICYHGSTVELDYFLMCTVNNAREEKLLRTSLTSRSSGGVLPLSGHLSLSQFTSLDFSRYSSNTPAKFVMHPDHRGGSQVGAAAVWRRQLLAKWEVWWIMKVLEMSLAIQEDIVLMAPITLLASLKFVGMSSVKILRQLALSSS